MNAPLAKVELTGVPETALWNLYQRASAARAGHLDDPRAALAEMVRVAKPAAPVWASVQLSFEGLPG